ncbi:MAG: hypothetical protein HEQ22_00495 [Sphingopyxis sp.]|uniref:hypothetical protein n=1 Tax=Sphingopyxis sp. TaxID=1908224 RepID=UPI003D80F73E
MAKDEIPAIRHYGRGDRVYVTAQRIWVILVALVEAKRLPNWKPRPGKGAPTITYGELVQLINRSHLAGRTIRNELGIIGHYCRMNSLPCLNTLVVNQFGECGESVVVSEGRDPAGDRREIMKIDWFAYGVPTTGTLRKVHSKFNVGH